MIRSRLRVTTNALLIALLGCFLSTPTNGQQLPQSQPPSRTYRPARYPKKQTPEQQMLTQQDQQLNQQVGKLVRKFHEAKDAKSKKPLREQIADLTTKQFDLRHQLRELEVKRLKKQLEEVETKVSRREELKDQIVERRIGDLLNEDNELRWEAPGRPTYPSNPLPLPPGPGIAYRTPGSLYSGAPISAGGFPPAATQPFSAGMFGPTNSPKIPTSPPTAQGYMKRNTVTTKEVSPSGTVTQRRPVFEMSYLRLDRKDFTRPPAIVGEGISDKSLKQLVDGKDVVWRVDVTGSKVTDEGLKTLAEIELLEGLLLGKSQVTDAGMKTVAKMKNLRILDLSNQPITDSGLAELQHLKKLGRLTLDNTKVTVEGIKGLVQANPLQRLSLNGIDLDDSLADALAGQDVQFLSIIDTKVTREGVDKLWDALPGCGIAYRWGPLTPPVPSLNPSYRTVDGNGPSTFTEYPKLYTQRQPYFTPLQPARPAESNSTGNMPRLQKPTTTRQAPPSAKTNDWQPANVPHASGPRSLDTTGPMAVAQIPKLPNGYTLANAKAAYEAAKTNAARVNALVESGLTSTEERDKTAHGLLKAKIAYEGAVAENQSIRKLLELNVAEARLKVERAETTLNTLREMLRKSPKSVSVSEKEKREFECQQRQIELDRCRMMLEMHLKSPETTPEKQNNSNPKREF